MRHFGDHGELHDPLGRCCDQCDPLPEPATSTGAPGRTSARTTVTSPTAAEPDQLDAAQSRIVAALRDWRRGRSGGKPAYTICRDASLIEIARNRPRGRTELLAIPGIGQGFVANHADDLFQTLASLDTGPSTSTAD
jgi:superfamily II DNA helicase RecQ